jgi:hypothetical protein
MPTTMVCPCTAWTDARGIGMSSSRPSAPTYTMPPSSRMTSTTKLDGSGPANARNSSPARALTCRESGGCSTVSRSSRTISGKVSIIE